MKIIVIFFLFYSMHIQTSYTIPNINQLDFFIEQLPLKEKIGQLFIATITQKKTKPYPSDTAYIKKLITNYHIGGIIFLGKSSIKKQKKITKKLATLTKIPLLVCQDFEPGSIMHARIPEIEQFPSAQEIAKKKDRDIFTIGEKIGDICNLLGVNTNFAPVIDIKTDNDNARIGHRSFGKNPKKVSRCAKQFIQGLQSKGIFSCVKHFPGHGNATINSHDDLPTITDDIKTLEKTALVPFRQIIKMGIDMIMIGHLSIPSLDNSGQPASLSRTIIIDFLREDLKFNGIVITDALDMQAITKYYTPEEAALAALYAGNDLILCCSNIPKAITLITTIVKAGIITEDEINVHVKRILLKKYALIN